MYLWFTGLPEIKKGRERKIQVKKLSEKNIERFLTNKMKEMGGASYKFISPGNAGMPDRLIITKTGGVFLVELKTEKGRLSKIQKAQIKKLRDKGVKVFITYGFNEVEDFLKEVERYDRARSTQISKTLCKRDD